jgi:hypothetical protein
MRRCFTREGGFFCVAALIKRGKQEKQRRKEQTCRAEEMQAHSTLPSQVHQFLILGKSTEKKKARVTRSEITSNDAHTHKCHREVDNALNNTYTYTHTYSHVNALRRITVVISS